MPTTANQLALRRNALVALLRDAPASRQQDLVDALKASGFPATQSSVSRDLTAIGAVRSQRGYELRSDDELEDDELGEAMGLLRELTPAGPNLLVIRTAIGGAQRVALALDRGTSADIVGTVAGDDTLFVATPDAQSQRRVIARLQRRDTRR